MQKNPVFKILQSSEYQYILGISHVYERPKELNEGEPPNSLPESPELVIFFILILHRFLDIDESTTGEHDCEQIVTNAIGGYTCSCNPGYELKDDGKSCTGKYVWYYILYYYSQLIFADLYGYEVAFYRLVRLHSS